MQVVCELERPPNIASCNSGGRSQPTTCSFCNCWYSHHNMLMSGELKWFLKEDGGGGCIFSRIHKYHIAGNFRKANIYEFTLSNIKSFLANEYHRHLVTQQRINPLDLRNINRLWKVIIECDQYAQLSLTYHYCHYKRISICTLPYGSSFPTKAAHTF